MVEKADSLMLPIGRATSSKEGSSSVHLAVVLKKILSSKRVMAGGAILLALIAMALFAPWFAPKDPMEQSLLNQLLPPVWMEGGDKQFLLGTDSLGRDLLSRLIYGAQPAVFVMFAGALGSAVIGTVLGMTAGYLGGWFDVVVSRTVEVFMAFPAILLAIVLVSVIGAGLATVSIAIALIGWTRFCRVVRGEVIALKSQDFMTSAKAIGMPQMRILVKEVLPNLLPLFWVLFGLEMGRAIVVETILSFVGFSSSGIATWGSIIADGRPYINQAWWLLTAPIVLIISVVLGLNALSDGLRNTFDPVLQR